MFASCARHREYAASTSSRSSTSNARCSIPTGSSGAHRRRPAGPNPAPRRILQVHDFLGSSVRRVSDLLSPNRAAPEGRDRTRGSLDIGDGEIDVVDALCWHHSSEDGIPSGSDGTRTRGLRRDRP